VVYREVCTEGSQTANSGTDSLSRIHFGKQELDMRLDKPDEQAQLVPGIGIPIPGTSVTVERLKKRGYVPLLELYNQSKPVNWDGTMSLGFLMT
jgi:hypothetical protein